MKKIERKWQSTFILFVLMLFSSFLFADPSITTYAATAAEVEITAIDYEKLTLTLKPNGNNIVYFSTNKTKWSEVEAKDNTQLDWVMDISWVSASKEVTLYFKGDIETEIVEVKLPKMNTSIKAKFDKVDGTITFSNIGNAEHFQWRKNTDYTWHTVPLDETHTDYKAFIKQLETFRVKGAKIVIRTVSVNGTPTSLGERPSKEITVSITKRGNVPSVKVNIKTLKLNTTVKQEYSEDNGTTWKECFKTMELADIAPSVLYNNGTPGTDKTILFRTIATNTAPHSKVLTLNIPGQKKAPVIGGKESSTVSCYTEDDKYFFLQFKDASANLQYEYVIIKPGKEFNATKAAWKTVKNSKLIKMSKKSVPEGTTVYIRYKGVAQNVSKGIELQLPSGYNSLNVTYKTAATK